MLLKEDVLEILPAIEEANSISEEMDKKMTFEAVMVPAESRGQLSGREEVRVTNASFSLSQPCGINIYTITRFAFSTILRLDA